MKDNRKLDNPDIETQSAWKILVADDEREVHVITAMVLHSFSFENRNLQIIDSYSEMETRDLLLKHPDIAVIILDVVMDSEHSGLDIIRFIREDLKNHDIRIILRTGQPGSAPESKVIIEYDINDYREKTEITSQKLKTSVIAALRSFRDLKKLEQQQKDLKHSQRFLKQILDAMDSIIIVVDENRDILLWNKKACECTSISADFVIGKNLFTVNKDYCVYAPSIDEVFTSSKPVKELYKTFVCDSELVVNFEFQLVKIGMKRAVLLRFDDVSELVKKDELLRRSQKLEAVGSLAAGLAHDVNNILGGITGAASLIETEQRQAVEDSDSSFEEYLDTIKSSTEKAGRLVQQLLSLARQGENRTALLDLTSLIQNVVNICESSFHKSIEIQSFLPKAAAYILADPDQIEQIVLNLCINASHAMTIMRDKSERHGGVLKINLSDEFSDSSDHNKTKGVRQRYWRLSVSDTGVGIPLEEQDKIFDPFYTTKTEKNGTGLGLAMVKRVLGEFEGSLQIESTVGRGTVFHLLFPASAKKGAKQELSNLAVADGKGLVLLCEDEELMQRVCRKILEKIGYSVVLAKDGQEALDQYQLLKDEIVAVLLDIMLPKLSGIDVIQVMLTTNPDLRAVISSGMKPDLLEEKGILNEKVVFLQKPYTLEKLSHALRDVIQYGK